VGELNDILLVPGEVAREPLLDPKGERIRS
jgi:hypothetical protein